MLQNLAHRVTSSGLPWSYFVERGEMLLLPLRGRQTRAGGRGPLGMGSWVWFHPSTWLTSSGPAGCIWGERAGDFTHPCLLLPHRQQKGFALPNVSGRCFPPSKSGIKITRTTETTVWRASLAARREAQPVGTH